MSRSYLELSMDEVEHAMALHEESIVIDASTVGFIEYVGEDLMLDDLLKGGVTASNATVCMQHNLSEAMGELARYHDWAEKKKVMTLIVKTSEDIVKAKKEGKTPSYSAPRTASSLRARPGSWTSPT
ncbi:MAG: hypothetical protein ACEROO_11900 [Candidatus Bathyarchaeota archaeon]